MPITEAKFKDQISRGTQTIFEEGKKLFAEDVNVVSLAAYNIYQWVDLIICDIWDYNKYHQKWLNEPECKFLVYRKCKSNTDEEKKNELIQEYAQIRYRLEELARQGQINEYMKCTILDMSNRVLEQIARNYDNVREGVRGIMVGKVLEYEAKTILRRGFSQGLSQGLYQGKKEEALNNARNFFLDGVKFETVRKNIQSLTEEELTEVYEDVQVQLRQSSKA